MISKKQIKSAKTSFLEKIQDNIREEISDRHNIEFNKRAKKLLHKYFKRKNGFDFEIERCYTESFDESYAQSGFSALFIRVYKDNDGFTLQGGSISLLDLEEEFIEISAEEFYAELDKVLNQIRAIRETKS